MRGSCPKMMSTTRQFELRGIHVAIRTKIALCGDSELQYLVGNRRSKELGCDKMRYHWGQVTLGQSALCPCCSGMSDNTKKLGQ